MNKLVSCGPFEEFDNFFRQGRVVTGSGRSRPWAPVVDISETKDAYVIHAELPVVKKEDIRLRIEKGLLVLEGERNHEKKDDSSQYHRVERS